MHVQPDSETRFQLQQRTTNGCLYFILFVAMIVGIIAGAVWLTSFVTDLWGTSIIIIFPAVLFGMLALQRRLLADTLATAGPEGLHLEVVKPGLHLEIAKAHYAWTLLRDYRFTRNRSGSFLRLRWSDGSWQYFIGGDIEPLLEYLKTHFPEQENTGFWG